MTENLLERYNYDAFIPANFEPWIRFTKGPALGEPPPKFPLWDMDELERNGPKAVVEFESAFGR